MTQCASQIQRLRNKIIFAPKGDGKPIAVRLLLDHSHTWAILCEALFRKDRACKRSAAYSPCQHWCRYMSPYVSVAVKSTGDFTRLYAHFRDQVACVSYM